jgi:hypothetical protein
MGLFKDRIKTKFGIPTTLDELNAEIESCDDYLELANRIFDYVNSNDEVVSQQHFYDYGAIKSNNYNEIAMYRQKLIDFKNAWLHKEISKKGSVADRSISTLNSIYKDNLNYSSFKKIFAVTNYSILETNINLLKIEKASIIRSDDYQLLSGKNISSK